MSLLGSSLGPVVSVAFGGVVGFGPGATGGVASGGVTSFGVGPLSFNSLVSHDVMPNSAEHSTHRKVVVARRVVIAARYYRSFPHQSSAASFSRLAQSSSLRRMSRAAVFSSRCATEDVPGMGRATGERLINHARLTWVGVAAWFFATV